MIGKMIGAIAGAKVAEHARGVSGPVGALIGVGIVAAIRRMSPVTLVAAAVGGYVLKRYTEKQATKKPAPRAAAR
ncbi:hypothetical protein [Altererythrobacter sp. Root672]|uniref:hypothetical protein n=1 Tax=Altererythrobacter sp. Root672 TaxID=1736584 RepID=UPI0006F852CA|nr:hypothetical protein [Altererythrobacter sp. Root672]KRA82750.1 hypothetical protein ASD76_01270 [Altererythrobacter sp. Root672]